MVWPNPLSSCACARTGVTANAANIRAAVIDRVVGRIHFLRESSVTRAALKDATSDPFHAGLRPDGHATIQRRGIRKPLSRQSGRGVPECEIVTPSPRKEFPAR